MDLSNAEILIGLAVVEVALTVLGVAGWWRSKRLRVSAAPTARHTVRPPSAPRPEFAEPVPEVSDSGRHHVPDELLRAATYRLTADRVARARVSEPEPVDPECPLNTGSLFLHRLDDAGPPTRAVEQRTNAGRFRRGT